MVASLGRVMAQLAEVSEVMPPKLIDLINQNIAPPSEVTEDDVYIRAMYIVSDQVNSFGGRFPVEEHQRLADLLVDSPVLVGHRKDKLPVGRNFHAETVEHDGRPWVKCYFYWLRSVEASENLRENIDGGIYKECSVAFTFRTPECSICGHDVRRCEHTPLEEYDNGEATETCHFNYRQIERVLETSLVYRGAVPRTSMSKELAAEDCSPSQQGTRHEVSPVVRLDELGALDKDKKWLVVPRYENLPVTMQVASGELVFAKLDGTPIPGGRWPSPEAIGFQPAREVVGLLVGYRGKQRCPTDQLEKYITGRPSMVTRLVFNLFPDEATGAFTSPEKKSSFEIRIIPHRAVSGLELPQACREVMTRQGVEIRSYETGLEQPGWFLAECYHYSPNARTDKEPCASSLSWRPGNRVAELDLIASDFGGESDVRMQLCGFDPERFKQGRHFVARQMTMYQDRLQTHEQQVIKLSAAPYDRNRPALDFEIDGNTHDRLRLRQITLGGRQGWLVYRERERPVVDVCSGGRQA